LGELAVVVVFFVVFSVVAESSKVVVEPLVEHYFYHGWVELVEFLVQNDEEYKFY